MTISFKTGQVKVPYFIPCSFQRQLSILLTQHLATSNEILFTNGGFRVKSAPESFSFLAGAQPQTPMGEYDASPDLLVDWGGSYPLHVPLPSQHIQCLNVRSSFLTTIGHLATLD